MTRKMLEQSQPSPEIIAVFGQHAGAGATTTAVNLSLALAAAGRSVLLIDLDPQGAATQALGYEGHERGGTEHILTEASITREMIAATKITEVYLSPAGDGLERLAGELAGMEDGQTRLYQALATLGVLPLEFEHVVIDCPPAFDLLTRNALTAAHRVLIPFATDTATTEELPALLKRFNQLRAGLPQPLYGLYLLMSLRAPTHAAQELVAQARHDYGRMSLLTEIPFEPRLKRPDRPNQPLLLWDQTREISQAYLSLAAEWLTLGQPGDQPDGTWRVKARQERMLRHRELMSKGIEDWRLDPLSGLYEPEEAMRRQDALALSELYQAAQRPNRLAPLLAWRPSRTTILTGLVILLSVPSFLWVRDWLSDAEQRIAIGSWVIGPGHSWEAGSHLLARADERAYRELLLAARLVEHNRERLIDCLARAETGAPEPCVIDWPAGDTQP